MTRRWVLFSLFLLGMTLPALPQDDSSLTLDEIVFLVDLGKSDDEIINHIEDHRLSFKSSPEMEKELRRRGVGERVLRAIQEVDLVDQAIRMREGGKSELDILQLIADRAVPVSLSTDEALRLHRKGLSIDVIRALTGDRRFQGFQTHSHPGGFFQLQHPTDWIRMEEMRDDQLVVAFTPDKGKASVKLLNVSVQIHAQVVGRDSPYSYLPLGRINEQMLKMRAWRKKVKGQHFRIIRLGDEIRIHGIPAILADTEYQRKGPVLRRWGVLLFFNGIEYVILMDAPADKFDRWEPVFRKILLSFTPSPGKLGNNVRREPIEPREVLKKYRNSVVKVNCGWKVGNLGWVWMRGTGFFVRRDGYLLTNHHVVWLDSWYGRTVRRYPDRITVEWDERLKRKPTDVKLVDAVRTDYPHVDIALLKAKGSDHTPMPLTRVFPPGKWVREQDQLLTLGFPAVVEMERKMAVTLTTTLGTLSKFNLLPDGTVDDVISDAVIHGDDKTLSLVERLCPLRDQGGEFNRLPVEFGELSFPVESLESLGEFCRKGSLVFLFLLFQLLQLHLEGLGRLGARRSEDDDRLAHTHPLELLEGLHIFTKNPYSPRIPGSEELLVFVGFLMLAAHGISSGGSMARPAGSAQNICAGSLLPISAGDPLVFSH